MRGRGRPAPLPFPGQPGRIFTVSELTREIAETLEGRFALVVVQGEITGLNLHTSGHVYFCLKDTASEIRVALFAREAVPVRQVLRNGLAVQVEGEVTVYAKRGEYQIRALRVVPVGFGALQAQYEALKRKLQAEGLFDLERKRALPRYPTRVGIVTSLSGAAIRDMIRILQARAPYLAITVADTRVQGEGASQEIAAAIRRMNRWGEVDVILVGRGGGSAQDLWAFNEEPVVRAIVASRIPIVSAVGHEVDFTLADLAADYRAATPTHAAQTIVKDAEEIRRTLRDITLHARNRIVWDLERARHHLRSWENHHALKEPERRIRDELQTLDRCRERLGRALTGGVTARRRRIELLTERLRAHAPSRSFARARDRVEGIRGRFSRGLATRLARERERIQGQARLLDSFDHRRVLERGYALVWSEAKGSLLRRGGALASGQPVEIQFYDAHARARIERIEREDAEGGKEPS